MFGVVAKERSNAAEPMIASDARLRPWQKVGTDMFYYRQSTYLLLVDYCSSYVKIAKLEKTTSSDVILHLRSVFARHSIPEVVVSDNGPQYAGFEFAKFAEEKGFTHIMSSPRYLQSNGKAERAVQTVKTLLKKATQPYDALLTYRTTALECGYSRGSGVGARRQRQEEQLWATLIHLARTWCRHRRLVCGAIDVIWYLRQHSHARLRQHSYARLRQHSYARLRQHSHMRLIRHSHARLHKRCSQTRRLRWLHLCQSLHGQGDLLCLHDDWTFSLQT